MLKTRQTSTEVAILAKYTSQNCRPQTPLPNDAWRNYGGRSCKRGEPPTNPVEGNDTGDRNIGDAI